jgi:hypothetical protein
MKQPVRYAAVLSIVPLIVCFVSLGSGQDKKIAKHDVPPAVIKAFETAYPKATVKNYGSEVEKGVTYYELETVEGKIKRDILYKADGTLAELEEILTPEMVPEPVAKALGASFPKGKIVSGEKTTRGELVSYDIVVADGKDKVNVELNAEGKILKKSVSTSKKSTGEKEKKEAEEKED